MQRRIISMLLALMLALTMFPYTALASQPFTLEAPQNLTATLKYDAENLPYFELKLDIPASVRQINDNLKQDADYYPGVSCDGIDIIFDYKYGQYDWNEGPTELWNTSDYLTEFIDRGGYYEYRPFDSGNFETVDIKSEAYSFRARFYALWGYQDDWIDKENYSAYSNIVTIGNPAVYQNASDWAKPELKAASDLGLIPDILKNADMTKPITREEFAELSVLLYEKATGKIATPASPNPFTDTSNAQILKAYALGITQGTSDSTFSPRVLINREQCATMLFRAIKAIAPAGNYAIAGVKDFADQQYISAWAVEGTKYMSKLGIIKGDNNGNFMPKAVTTVQEAAGYGMATREAAVLMTVRTYQALK
ncbi:MAG: S-layer homology domain-containing protein [Syntrophomonadaceae bacterium]|jgi:hypothetical protein